MFDQRSLNAVTAQLHRSVLAEEIRASRSVLVPLLRGQATGAEVDPDIWFCIADAAEHLIATVTCAARFAAEAHPDVARAIQPEVEICEFVGQKLRELAATVQVSAANANRLAQDAEQLIQSLLPQIRQADASWRRTYESAVSVDLDVKKKLNAFHETFDKTREQVLEGWRASDQYAAAVAAGLAAPGASTPSNAHRPLDVILAELDALVGLASVKHEVRSLLNLLRVNREREGLGLKSASVSLHVVFAGPPGTGKTTVARLYGEFLGAMGLLRRGHLKEAARQDLVAEYVGQTAVKTNALIDEALDGVLFIDEAYSLAPPDARQDFGREAVEVLLKRMEDDRQRIAVIAAGYTEEMARFINSNPGLESRFTQTLAFPSYSPEELLAILHLQAAAEGLQIDPSAHQAAWRTIYRAWQTSDDHFGNARYVRRLLEGALRRQANRLASESSPSPLRLTTLVGDDVPRYEYD